MAFRLGLLGVLLMSRLEFWVLAKSVKEVKYPFPALTSRVPSVNIMNPWRWWPG